VRPEREASWGRERQFRFGQDTGVVAQIDGFRLTPSDPFPPSHGDGLREAGEQDAYRRAWGEDLIAVPRPTIYGSENSNFGLYAYSSRAPRRWQGRQTMVTGQKRRGKVPVLRPPGRAYEAAEREPVGEFTQKESCLANTLSDHRPAGRPKSRKRARKAGRLGGVCIRVIGAMGQMNVFVSHLKSLAEKIAPLGHEDATGFHFGEPMRSQGGCSRDLVLAVDMRRCPKRKRRRGGLPQQPKHPSKAR
jgi:hypothetical protein